MLVEFSVGNFWSFKEIQTLQMQAAKIKSKFPKVDKENVFVVNDKLSLLKSKAIYGANASGKTNLVRALISLLYIVRDSVKDSRVLENNIAPFLLNDETVKQPSFFQIVFVLEGVQYRYGFEASNQKIYSEWLFALPLLEKNVKERYYFLREEMDVSVNGERYKEGLRFAKTNEQPPLYREDSLFISVVAAWNGLLADKIIKFLRERIAIVSGLGDNHLAGLALALMSDKKFEEKVTSLLRGIDRTIEKIEKRVEIDIEPEKNGLENEEQLGAVEKARKSELKRRDDLALFRSQYDAEGKVVKQVPMFLKAQEAEGTKKLFNLSPVLFSTLERGGTLLIDEFDARMHPRLTRKIIELFHSKSTNPNDAQLIFVTHDSTLLDAKLLRRDQVSFAKKDRFGATELYSLVEFKGVRNDASFEKDYLLGRYNAVPNNLYELEAAFATDLIHAENDEAN